MGRIDRRKGRTESWRDKEERGVEIMKERIKIDRKTKAVRQTERK